MTKATESTVNLREYACILRRRKWLLILAVLTVTSVAIAGSYLLTPRYESTALIRLGKQSILGAAVRGLTPEGQRAPFTSHSEKVESLRRRILSSVYIEQLIDKMGWVDKIIAAGGPEAQAAQTAPDSRRAIISLLVDRYQRAIRVDLIGNDFVEITFPSSDPAEAKQAATLLAGIFRDNMIKEEVAAIRVAGEFSEEQLEIYRQKWEDAQNRLAEFESAKARKGVDDQLENERNLQDVVNEKDAVELELSAAEDKIAQRKDELGSDGVARAEFIYSDRLTALRTEQLSLIERLSDMLGKYSWKDRVVVDYNYRIGTGLNNIQAEITRIVDETLTDLSPAEHEAIIELAYLNIKLDFLEEKERAMNRIVNRIRDRMATGPEYAQQLRRLETEEAASRDIHSRFVSQYTGAQIRQAEQRAAAETMYTLIEPPAKPLVPVYPDRKKIAVAAALIGLVFGFVLVFLAEYSDHSFRAVEDVEEHLGCKVVAAVPRIVSLKEAQFAGKR